MSKINSSRRQGDVIDLPVLNEEKTYYDMMKDIFSMFADSVTKDKARLPLMSIVGMFTFLRRIGLLDEIVMTALDLDELFNRFKFPSAMDMTYEQFWSMMDHFSTKKAIDINILIKYIIEQTHNTLLPSSMESVSDASSSSLSPRSDVSNAYTYYPVGHPRYGCPDQESSTEDEAEDNLLLSNDEEDIPDTPTATKKRKSVAVPRTNENENEDEVLDVHISATQLEMPPSSHPELGGDYSLSNNQPERESIIETK